MQKRAYLRWIRPRKGHTVRNVFNQNPFTYVFFNILKFFDVSLFYNTVATAYIQVAYIICKSRLYVKYFGIPKPNLDKIRFYLMPLYANRLYAKVAYMQKSLICIQRNLFTSFL